jgi:hypothetical protein
VEIGGRHAFVGQFVTEYVGLGIEEGDPGMPAEQHDEQNQEENPLLLS